jgi:cysteine desulfurase
VQQLSRLGVACSSGSACRSGHAKDSAVLTAMDVAPSWRQSLLRFSLGPWLSDDDLDAVPALLIRAIDACT